MPTRFRFLRPFMPLFIVLGICALGAAILFPVFGHARENARRSSCQSNQKQIMLGFKQYAQDYDDKFPLTIVHLSTKSPGTKSKPAKATVVDVGWGESLQPYLKSICIYSCPSEFTAIDSAPFPAKNSGGSYSDYWMNSRLAGRRASNSQVISLGDGTGRHDLNYAGTSAYALNSLPVNWQNLAGEAGQYGTQEPWFKRHMGGANYAFADGHVKWLLPEQVDTADARFKP